MSAIVNFPYFYIGDPTKGRPVFNGSVFIGVPDLDPTIVGNQLAIKVRQEDGTEVSVTQPVATNAGGTLTYLGSPVQIVVDGAYSMAVLNSQGSQVYYVSSVGGANDLAGTDLRYGTIFATVAAMTAANPVSIDGVEVDLVAGMSVSLQGYDAAGDSGFKTGLIAASQAVDEEADHTNANGTVFLMDGERRRASQVGCALANTATANADALKAAYEWIDGGGRRHLDIDISFTVLGTDANTVLIDPAGTDYALHVIDSTFGSKVSGLGTVSFTKNTTRRIWALVFKDCVQPQDEMNIGWGFTPVAATVTTSSQHGTMLFNCTQGLTTKSAKQNMDGAPFSSTGQPVSPSTDLNSGLGNKCIGNYFNYFEQCSTFGAGTLMFEFASNVCRNHWLSGIKISTNPSVATNFINTVGSYNIHDNQHFWSADFEVPLQVNGVDPTFPHAVMFEGAGRIANYHDNQVDMSQLALAQVNSNVACLYALGDTTNDGDLLLQDLAIKGNTFIPTPHHTDGNLAKISGLVNNLDWSGNTELNGWIRLNTSNTISLRRGNYNFNFAGKKPEGAQFVSDTVNIAADKIFAERLSIGGDMNGGVVRFGTNIDATKLSISNLENFAAISMNDGADEITTDRCSLRSCDGGTYDMKFAATINKLVGLDLSAQTASTAYKFVTQNSACEVELDIQCTGAGSNETSGTALNLDNGALRVNSYKLSALTATAFVFGAGVFIRAGDYYGSGTPTESAFNGVRYTDLSGSGGGTRNWIKTSLSAAVGWEKITSAP